MKYPQVRSPAPLDGSLPLTGELDGAVPEPKLKTVIAVCQPDRGILHPSMSRASLLPA